jgi:hypothetical protein
MIRLDLQTDIAGPYPLLHFASFHSVQVVPLNSLRLAQWAITQSLSLTKQYKKSKPLYTNEI